MRLWSVLLIQSDVKTVYPIFFDISYIIYVSVTFVVWLPVLLRYQHVLVCCFIHVSFTADQVVGPPDVHSYGRRNGTWAPSEETKLSNQFLHVCGY